MSAPGKFDYSSSGPDRPLYSTGQRGSNLTAQMERSSSFREGMEHPVLASHPSILRSTSSITQGDVVNFFQCLRFDPKVVAADHKSIRQGDFKRHVNVALGITGDESPSGLLKGKLIPSPIPEEIKRLKSGLRENLVKARERVKIFNEASSVFNKFFPSIPTKKRSRPESYSSDRSNDRSVLGTGLGKMGIQSQTVASGFELEQQERTKTTVPNKRTRTSLMDVRSNAIVRPSANDREKETVRLANSSAVPGEDRASSIGMDGWEKSKMKKKRSGIKTDASPSLPSNKPVDGYREMKQGMQQKSASDSRSRLNGDSQSFRSGAANGASGFGRSEGISQQMGLAMRSSGPRADSDHASLYNEKRERPIGSEKERVNLRAVNKMNIHDEFNSSSPTSNTKMNASVRGPRSGSGLPPKLSPVVHCTTSPSDWDISSCTNKPPTASGVSNRKRTTSNRSSSPPVAHWAGQRPQKISRIARRTNLVPIVSNSDETPPLDSTSDVGCNEVGFGFPKRSPAASPQQVKLKGDSLSTAALSESEESGATEIKSKDKGKQSDEVDEKAVQHVQKATTSVLPSRKNKLVTGDEPGDGVRRQGRTGRGFASTRSLMPMAVEKLGNVGTAKQLRSTRLGFDKSESKAGRPPTRKLSDRKAYKRQKHTATNAAVDFLLGSDDGHEELLAAANAVINSAHTFSSSFWKQMEPFFSFISDLDIAFLKQQEDLASITPIPTGISSRLDGFGTANVGYSFAERENELRLATYGRSGEVRTEEFAPGRGDSKADPLYQRLLAALISEEDCSGIDEDDLDGFGTNIEVDAEPESNGLSHMVKFGSACQTAFNGYGMTEKLDHEESEDDVAVVLHKGRSTNHYLNGAFSDHLSVRAVDSSELQYDDLPIDEKICLEAQSIGISIEPMPDISNAEDEGLSNDIKKLEEKCHEEGLKKKGLIDGLLKHATEMKELQEKEFDQLAYEKLVGMAYDKYMACRRHHATGAKSSSNKLSKQAALAFVKRTLERCHQYESTGKSCFSEPVFRDMFISGFARTVDSLTDGESMQPYANGLEVRASGLQPSSSLTSRLCQNGDNYANSSDMLPTDNLLPETIGREDTWSTRGKKRELLLDDVGGPSGIGSSLSSSTKGKRSERERDGKGQASSRSGTNKLGRPSLSNAKGERKSKTKPKQKTTQLSTSLKISEQPKSSVSKSGEANANNNVKDNNEFNLDVLDESEPLDLSHLQIPDGLGGPDDLDNHAQDLSSWLNIDDDALQDHDLMGLQIPMDDLSDLNMMV